MSIAILTIRTSSMDGTPLSFAFDTFPSADGYASYQGMHEEEELTSAGVNGKRWRTVFDQWQPLVVEAAWMSQSSHSVACNTADQMRAAKGRQGLLIVGSGGTRTVRLNVHVTAVRPVVSPGIIIGPGITTGAAAVVSSWVFDVFEVLT